MYVVTWSTIAIKASRCIMLENMLWLTCCVVLRGLGAIPIVFAIALYINPFDARVHRVGHVLLEAPYRDHVLSLSKLEVFSKHCIFWTKTSF